MRPLPVIFVLSLGLLRILTFPSVCIAQKSSVKSGKPIWSRQAASLDLSCATKEQVIPSPDHLSSVKITCHDGKVESLSVNLHMAASGQDFEVPLNFSAEELLWAPNSRAFFVNGGMSGYAGFFVSIYILDAERGIQEVTITDKAQMNMVESFPPCRAWRIDRNCDEVAKNPEYNMSGLAWTLDSSAIYVVAEVPCSSSYGGIMCQALGYELAVPDGRILSRLSAREAKKQWGKYAAWTIRVPDPPRYDPAM